MIPVFRPKMNKEEILPELGKIFDTGWIGLGPKTAEFAVSHLAKVVLGLKESMNNTIRFGR